MWFWNRPKRVRIALIAGAAAIAIALLFLLLCFNYVIAIGVLAKEWRPLKAFWNNGDVLYPARDVYRHLTDPWTSKALSLAAVLAGMEIALAFFGLMASREQSSNPKPEGGARFATRRDLEMAGLLDGRPGYSIFLGTVGGKEVTYRGSIEKFYGQNTLSAARRCVTPGRAMFT